MPPSTSSRTQTPTKPPALSRQLPWMLLLGGATGLAAALALILERMALLKDPDHIPACSINPVLNCGSVMSTWQAEAFGFPNPLIGIAAFSALAAVGAVLLTGGTLARPAWIALVMGAAAGLVFVHWLIYQSLYVIGALCPYCMAVWVVTIAAFWSVLVHVASAGHLGRGPFIRAFNRTLGAYHGAALTAWYLAIVALILVRFWSYWRTLLV